MKLAWAIVLSISLACLLGCGTTANLEGKQLALDLPGQVEPRIYGGVRNDLRWYGSRRHGIISPCALFLLDVPLSAAADTITIPHVIHLRRHPEKWKMGYPMPNHPNSKAAPDDDAVNLSSDSDDPSDTYAPVVEALADENPDQYLEYLDESQHAD